MCVCVCTMYIYRFHDRWLYVSISFVIVLYIVSCIYVVFTHDSVPPKRWWWFSKRAWRIAIRAICVLVSVGDIGFNLDPFCRGGGVVANGVCGWWSTPPLSTNVDEKKGRLYDYNLCQIQPKIDLIHNNPIDTFLRTFFMEGAIDIVWPKKKRSPVFKTVQIWRELVFSDRQIFV